MKKNFHMKHDGQRPTQYSAKKLNAKDLLPRAGSFLKNLGGKIAGWAAVFFAGVITWVKGLGKRPAGEPRGPLFRARKKPRNLVLSIFITSIQVLLVAILIIGVSGIGAVIGVAKTYMETTPMLDLAKLEKQSQTSFIYDANGQLITSFAGIENRVFAPIEQIPQMLQDAVVAIEDARFYTHNGVDYKRIVGALLSNLQSNSTQGGSTLTQQLVKMRLLTSDQTYKRKLQEAYLSTQLEKTYSKQDILEAYLNTIPLGQSNYGVKTAAEDYFGKSLDQLSLRECAMLVGITKSPYKYDPRLNYYIRKKPEVTNERTNLVLFQMYKSGYIDQAQYEQALHEDVVIKEKSATRQLYDMPYFVEYAIYDVVTTVLTVRNLPDTPTNRTGVENELRTGGYHIYTTVDPEIQHIVEDTLYNWTKYPKTAKAADQVALVSNPDGTITQIDQPQAAAVVVDYHSGQIKAMVGGRTPPTTRKSLNRAYQAHMPVGSSIKPLAVYAPALDIGMSPASIQYNLPGPLQGWGTTPKNYSGGSYSGPMTLRQAVRESVNVVAARVLMEDVTVEQSQSYLLNMGIKSPLNLDGPGLALGTSGITPLEMANSYGVFGNKGQYIQPISFTKVLDSKGNVVLDAQAMQIRRTVFKPSTAWLMVDILKDAIKNGTGTRAKFSALKMEVAGKTGTNSDARGVFFAGLTPYYSGAVWVGSDRYKPLYSGAQGGRDAAPLWKDFMEKIHVAKSLTDRSIIPDSPASLGLVPVEVCSVSGMRATDACRHDANGTLPVTDWFLSTEQPTEECNWHVDIPYCTESGKLATPYCPASKQETKSLLLIPGDSTLRTIEPGILLKYIPNAVLDLPGIEDLSMLTPDNPLYAQYFCNIHNEQWSQQQQAWDDLALASTELISKVQNQMLTATNLSSANINLLNNAIANLQNLITQQASYDQLNEGYTYLQSLKQDLLS